MPFIEIYRIENVKLANGNIYSKRSLCPEMFTSELVRKNVIRLRVHAKRYVFRIVEASTI